MRKIKRVQLHNRTINQLSDSQFKVDFDKKIFPDIIRQQIIFDNDLLYGGWRDVDLFLKHLAHRRGRSL